MNTYDLGDKIRSSVIFRRITDTAVLDPDVVKFSFCTPDGTVTTYVYLDGAEIVRDDEGEYHVDISLDTKGTWYHRWFSTGNGQAAAEERIEVRPSRAM